jgi:hypothetical protein
MDQDVANIQAGKQPLPIGTRFGVDRCVTAIAQKGRAVIEANIGGTSTYSAPREPSEIAPYSPQELRTPFISYEPDALTVKPAYSSKNYTESGRPVSSSSLQYGVLGVGILIAILLLVAIIAVTIYAIIDLTGRQAAAKKTSYKDKTGCQHTVWTSQNSLLSTAGMTDLNECTGDVSNTGGSGWGIFSTGAFTGATSTQIGNIVMGVGALIAVGIVAMVVLKYFKPEMYNRAMDRSKKVVGGLKTAAA